MPARVARQWFDPYVIVDLYSRKLVGFGVHASDQAERAARLVYLTALAEGIKLREREVVFARSVAAAPDGRP